MTRCCRHPRTDRVTVGGLLESTHRNDSRRPGAAVSPGTTNVTVNTNQAKQLCAGRYGTISLATGATLNLNGGVYQVTRLNLADGAHLEPSEPVVILVSGAMTAGANASVRP